MQLTMVICTEDRTLLDFLYDTLLGVSIPNHVRDEVSLLRGVVVMELKRPCTLVTGEAADLAIKTPFVFLKPHSYLALAVTDFFPHLDDMLLIVCLLITTIVGSSFFRVLVRHSLIFRLLCTKAQGFHAVAHGIGHFITIHRPHSQ